MNARDRINLNIFSFVYDMSDEAVYCIDCAMFLFVGKQNSFSSFFNKGQKGCYNIPRKLEIKSAQPIS